MSIHPITSGPLHFLVERVNRGNPIYVAIRVRVVAFFVQCYTRMKLDPYFETARFPRLTTVYMVIVRKCV